jgi:hypothetical protein
MNVFEASIVFSALLDASRSRVESPLDSLT